MLQGLASLFLPWKSNCLGTALEVNGSRWKKNLEVGEIELLDGTGLLGLGQLRLLPGQLLRLED